MAYTCGEAEQDIGRWFDRMEDTEARDRALAHIWANHNHRKDDATCISCYIYWLNKEHHSKDLVFPDPSAEPSL